eukprot:contig_28547_g7020
MMGRRTWGNPGRVTAAPVGCVGTTRVVVAAAAVLSFSAASFSAVTALTSLATTATIFGKSGGATSDCPITLVIPATINTTTRFDGTLSVPVSGLSINGAACQGVGVLIGGAYSAFNRETNATKPLGALNKVYQDSGASLFDQYLRLASGGDFDVFYFPRDANTLCGGWE